MKYRISPPKSTELDKQKPKLKKSDFCFSFIHNVFVCVQVIVLFACPLFDTKKTT